MPIKENNDKRMIAVAFNMALFDTREINSAAYGRACEANGVVIPQTLHICDRDGLVDKDVLRVLFTARIHNMTADNIIQMKDLFYLQDIDKIKLNEKLMAMIIQRSIDTRVFVVSSDRRKVVETALEKFGIRKLFDGVITREDVRQPKPMPYCYMLASQRAKIAPNRIDVYDNGNNGKKAALSAGCNICELPN